MDELSLHLLDIAMNSIEAGATRVGVAVVEEPDLDRLTLEVSDNGRGMDPGTLAKVLDPFFTTRTTRAVGMGLPLLRAAAAAAGGGVRIHSQPHAATTVTASFQLSHVGRAPLGDIETTFMVLVGMKPDVELILSHRRGHAGYELRTSDLLDALGGLPLSSPEGITLAREAIRHCEADLAAGGTAPVTVSTEGARA